MYRQATFLASAGEIWCDIDVHGSQECSRVNPSLRSLPWLPRVLQLSHACTGF